MLVIVFILRHKENERFDFLMSDDRTSVKLVIIKWNWENDARVYLGLYQHCDNSCIHVNGEKMTEFETNKWLHVMH